MGIAGNRPEMVEKRCGRVAGMPFSVKCSRISRLGSGECGCFPANEAEHCGYGGDPFLPQTPTARELAGDLSLRDVVAGLLISD